MASVPGSYLNLENIIKKVFDNTSDSLRITNGPGSPPINIIISSTDDSIALGDVAGNLATITNNALDINIKGVVPSSGRLPVDIGSATVTISGPVTVSNEVEITNDIGSPIPVSATDLDIRNLVFATDKVDASGSSVSISNTPTVDLGDINGIATEATLSTLNTKIPSNLTVTSNRLEVDGSGVTQPVLITGTPAVSITNFPAIQTVNGTVTANIGTTNGLALDTSVNSLLKPSSTLSAVTSITDTVTIKADLAANQLNALKVDGSAVTQPISGTVSISSLPNVTVSNFPAIQPVSGTITANLGTIGDVATNSTLTTGNAKSIVRGGAKGVTSDADVTSTDIDTNTQALDVSVKGIANVSVGNFPATQNVSVTNPSLAVTQSGTWNVGVTGTANVNITNTAVPVSITGLKEVTLDAASLAALENITVIVDSLPAGAANAANQVTGNNSLANIDSKMTTVTNSLVSIDAGIPTALGQTTMANSMPVTIASDQPAFAVTDNGGSLTVDGTVAATQSGTWNQRLQDGSGNAITSQVSGAQRSLDVGVTVAGVQVDPRNATPGTITASSATATNTSTVAIASNANRKFLLIQNNTNQSVWINFNAAATNSAPSTQLTPGASLNFSGSFVPTQEIRVIRGGAANVTFTILEGV